MFSFDHVVHYTKDPEQAAGKMNDLGLQAFSGGEHPNWGTYNSLCYFDLSYIEFIGIRDDELAKSVTDNLLIQRVVQQAHFGEGLSQFALRTQNMKETARSLKEKGFQVGEPIPGKRTRTDGHVLEWQLLFPERTGYDGPPLPFIIQWEEDDETRRSDLKRQRMISPHKNGNPKLASIGIAVNNLQQRVHEWAQWFNLEKGNEFQDERLRARCQPLFLEGSHLLFCEPYAPGPAREVLQTRGEHPFLVTLSQTGQQEDLDLMGAVYRLETKKSIGY